MSRNGDDYQPSNITFSHLPPWDGPRLPKRTKYEAMAGRALRALSSWASEQGLEPGLAADELLLVPGLAPELGAGAPAAPPATPQPDASV